MDSHYMCNSNNCIITTEGGGSTRIYGGDRNFHKIGHFFLFICGEYEEGILHATGGDLRSMTQYCATVYNCTDPQDCWMEDIKVHEYDQNIDGVKAVSIMPGCKLVCKSLIISLC